MKQLAILFFFLSLIAPVYGDESSEYLNSIARGSAWLAGQQNPNGSFGKIPGVKEQGDVGVTGLVLMAFGNAPQEIREKHKDVLEKALVYMLKHQDSSGAIHNPERGVTNYQTSISLIALCLLDKKRFATQIDKARDYLVNTQFSETYQNVKPEDWNYGGWDYNVKKVRPESDMSNVQFAMEALHEAGLDKNSPVWQRAVKFLSRCQNRSESNDMKGFAVLNDGGFMYFPGNSKVGTVQANGQEAHPSYASMTYAGLKSFIYANVDKKDPRVVAAYNWIRRHYTLEENYGLGTRENPKGGQQGLFYYYTTFAKAMEATGDHTIVSADGQKHSWSKDLCKKFISIQHKDGYWVNANPRWWEGDPTLATAYSLIAFNTAFRNIKSK